MVLLTSKECHRFMADPSHNPLTKRNIHVGTKLYQTLHSLCFKKYDAPPMGPVLHLKMDGDMYYERNLSLMLKFTNDMIKEWYDSKKTKIVFKTQIGECRGILQASKIYYKDNKAVIEKLNGLEIKLNTIKEKHIVFDDTPKIRTIGNVAVKRSRLFNRSQVLKCYNQYHKIKRVMTNTIVSNKLRGFVSEQKFQQVLSS